MDKVVNYYFLPLTFKRYDINETYTNYIAAVRTYETTPKQKYILISVLNNDATLDVARINQLRWFSIITTEELKPIMKYQIQPFYRSLKDDDVSTDRILTVIDRDYDKTIYNNTLGLPIKVILLHNKKKRSMLQFPDELTLHQALNSYNCIVKRTDF